MSKGRYRSHALFRLTSRPDPPLPSVVRTQPHANSSPRKGIRPNASMLIPSPRGLQRAPSQDATPAAAEPSQPTMRPAPMTLPRNGKSDWTFSMSEPTCSHAEPFHRVTSEERNGKPYPPVRPVAV